jgi:citrate:succinate antiporter/L-tartrate/succinate antiporter
VGYGRRALHGSAREDSNTRNGGAMSIEWKRWAPIVVGLALLISPVPSGLKPDAWHYFAVFAAVIAGLVLESMPAGAVGLIGLTVAALSGWVEKDPNRALRWALSGFSESTVWLIVGAFIFALGYRKSGIGRRIALLLVRALGRSTLGLGYAVLMADLLLAPATPSNTARSGGTIYPIVSNIPRIYGSEPGPTAGRIGTYVMWTAFAATAVTSSLFLTALAPNVAGLAIAKKTVGIDVGWGQWFIGFLPLGVLLIGAVPLLAYAVCRPQVKASPEIADWASSELKSIGPMSRDEHVMVVLVLLAMFLWITGSNPSIVLPVLGANYINPTMVVFVVISLLLLTGVIEFADIVAEKSAWEVLFYFTSLLTLASGSTTSGSSSGWPRAFAKHLGAMSPTMATIMLGDAVLLDPLRLLEHHVARGGRCCPWC